jgi:hypothetical protein
MIERILILVTLMALSGVLWALLRQRQARRLAGLARQRPFAGIVPVGQPAIVAFTLPTCAECRARQTPALERLRQQLGPTVQITTLSADTHATLVERLGIMTVPATAILDPEGVVRTLNQGFADETRLLQQLAMLNPAPVSAATNFPADTR